MTIKEFASLPIFIYRYINRHQLHQIVNENMKYYETIKITLKEMSIILLVSVFQAVKHELLSREYNIIDTCYF